MSKGQFTFAEVFAAEVASVNKRRKKTDELRAAAKPPRKKLDRPDVVLESEGIETSDGSTPLRPAENAGLVGLALSGGGVRSSAFCLGVLQALRAAGVIDHVDYLSTVSGGGYIGSSLSAGMSANGGHFPFKSELSEDETPSTQHIRDYSNFLFPNGAIDLLYNAAIYFRGLTANLVLILLFMLPAAALTIVWYRLFQFNNFMFTIWLSLILLVVNIAWGIWRSRKDQGRAPELPSYWTEKTSWLVLVLLAVAFCELQPFIIEEMRENKGLAGSIVDWAAKLSPYLAPVAVAIAFIAQKLGSFAKSALESERTRDKIGGIAAKATIYVAAAVLPLLLWVVYLHLSYWAICETHSCKGTSPAWLGAMGGFVQWLAPGLTGNNDLILALAYVLIAFLFFYILRWLRPNANSLHPLYRDRLSKAYLFIPQKEVPSHPVTGEQQELAPLAKRNLSDLSEEYAPYHLINTALNVQNSDTVNRRGRNADFFMFSRNFVGSKATGYVATTAMERAMVGLDLAAAMAASGAAASANMGAATIKALSPTLALLNIRLGYWLRNPRRVQEEGGWNRWANFYFLFEMFGQLNEKLRSVYLTDGGHIENLGMYELLRRRCKVIIAVDGEADPQMGFSSFNVLERHALIDLGVRIDLPWLGIAAVTKATGSAIDAKGDAPKLGGPHVAVGEIRYPNNRRGILVYIKSSLTGDENDYIFHYKKRYGDFPHETTLDQLFTEEQFEAYRALGFHAAYGFFDRRDSFAHLKTAINPCVADDIGYLDSKFPPPPATDPCWPRPVNSFSEWLKQPVQEQPADVRRKKKRTAEQVP